MRKPLPANVDEINAALSRAAVENRNSSAPVVPRTPRPRSREWHANRAFDEAAGKKAEPTEKPVDEVQCEVCGHHWNYNERKLCPVCFEE